MEPEKESTKYASPAESTQPSATLYQLTSIEQFEYLTEVVMCLLLTSSNINFILCIK